MRIGGKISSYGQHKKGLIWQMKDNRGVTLVELLVVMLIMGILAGGAMYGIRSLNTGSAQSTTKRIEAMLDYVRLEHRSKDQNYYLCIEEERGKYYLLIQTEGSSGRETVSKEKLELREGEISFVYQTYGEEGDNLVLVHSTLVVGGNVMEQLEVCFSKETGAFLPNRFNQIIKAIKVEASGRSYTIHLVQATGKHYTE